MIFSETWPKSDFLKGLLSFIPHTCHVQVFGKFTIQLCNCEVIKILTYNTVVVHTGNNSQVS